MVVVVVIRLRAAAVAAVDVVGCAARLGWKGGERVSRAPRCYAFASRPVSYYGVDGCAVLIFATSA